MAKKKKNKGGVYMGNIKRRRWYEFRKQKTKRGRTKKERYK